MHHNSKPFSFGEFDPTRQTRQKKFCVFRHDVADKSVVRQRANLVRNLIKRFLITRILSPYVTLDGSYLQLWLLAASRAPVAYRWFGRTVDVADLDAEYGDFDDWLALRSRLQSGDRLWPFTINPYSMSMRKGFVAIRDGKPFGGFVTIVS